MSANFFTQLEAELGGLTRDGVHLGDGTRRRRRVTLAIRRGLAITALAVALAASLDSEFPAVASGHGQLPSALVQSA